MLSTALLVSQVTLAMVPSNRIPHYAIIISEIMADPDPSVMLPAFEYIELHNTSHVPVWVTGFTLSDKTTTGTIQAPTLMLPGAYLIVCALAHKDTFALYGSVATLTRFPSLDNGGDLIVLSDDQSNVIHAVAYHISWYKNPVKQMGGWSLEMIDTNTPCYDADAGNRGSNNWKASTHAAGGTPGMPNSVQLPLEQLPDFLKVHSYIIAPGLVHVHFDQALDENSTLHIASIHVQEQGNHSWQQVLVNKTALAPPFFKELTIHTDHPFEPDKLYQIELRNIASCYQATEPIARIQVASAIGGMPEPGSIHITEILFDPVPPVEDYIELYNSGSKAIDLALLYLASTNTQGALIVASKVASTTQLLFPNEYLAVSTNTIAIWENFPGTSFQHLQMVPSMPSLPNAGGNIALIDAFGVLIDKVLYSPDWHHKLLGNTKGISLEKILPNGSSSDPNNWHSTATVPASGSFLNSILRNINSSLRNSYNYGSPGAANTQSTSNFNLANTYFNMPNKLFTPNNDGNQDFLLIQYQLPEPGWIVNCAIFHKDGSLARTLAQQKLIGTKGAFMWDGTNNARQQLGTGHYICSINAFHSTGKKLNWKQTISLFNVQHP